MTDTTMQLVCEAVSKIGNMDIKQAEMTVRKSWFPELYQDNPSYVQHYNAEYWAEHILGIREW